MKPLTHTRRTEAFVCAVCARRSNGLGYRLPGFKADAPLYYICDDPDCQKIIRKTYAMTEKEFSSIENEAAQKGRISAEQYCDEIGQSDFRAMTQGQAEEFARRLVAGYRNALKVELASNFDDDEIPF